jgi:hypothetical protein
MTVTEGRFAAVIAAIVLVVTAASRHVMNAPQRGFLCSIV